MALPVMTQTELIADLSDATSVPRADVKKVLEELQNQIEWGIANCIRIRFAGITVEPALRAASKKRLGRNPSTGEEIEIPAKPASVRLKASVARSYKDHVPSTMKLKKKISEARR